jgi:glycosyltransferase involved in cell wall biosynthesis
VKVIHVPYTFWPDPVGGTEVYVDTLAREQRRNRLDAVVAAPGAAESRYTHESLPVRRFPVAEPVQDIRELYGDGDTVAANAFGRILDAEGPQVVHLHAFTRGVSLRLVREAKRRGISVVFSYHTPTVSCQRGTLLRWGAEICDGRLEVRRCSQCSLHGLGLNRFGSIALGYIPTAVGETLGRAGLAGGVWTAARTTELMSLRHATFRSLVTEVDHVVAMSRWVSDLLLRNGVPSWKVSVSNQGLGKVTSTTSLPTANRSSTSSPLKVMFIGRLDPMKGLHLLINAIRSAPALLAELHIFGSTQSASHETYARRLMEMSNGDRRILFKGAAPSDEVVDLMRRYDVIAVPSQCLETGPLVVMEAFAAGVPVIGSNLGGIAELVRDGEDGLLIEPANPTAWRSGLERLCDDLRYLQSLKERISQPPSIATAARQLFALYSTVNSTLGAEPLQARAGEPLRHVDAVI